MRKKLLDSIFSDHMVLPADKRFSVGGTTVKGARVMGRIANQEVSTIADQTGSFTLYFDPISDRQGSYTLTVKAEDKTETVSDIRFGKVLMFAGQSNIEFELKDDPSFEGLCKSYIEKDIYFYNVPKIEYIEADGSIIPNDLAVGIWKKISKKNLGEVSAIAFYAACKIMEGMDGREAIGIVDCYKGGTSASCWLPESVLTEDEELYHHFLAPYKQATIGKSESDFSELLDQYQKKVNEHQKNLADYRKQFPDISLSEAKHVVGHTPWPPPMHPRSYLRPGGLFQTMILPLKNITLNHIIWYQGENDTENTQVYEKLLTKLIFSWRELFQDNSLPFTLIQLPGYADGEADTWAQIRSIQQKAVRIPEVHLVSIADTGERHNIHPADKSQAGKRLGELLSEKTYQSTPMLEQAIQAKESLELIFSGCYELSFENDCMIYGRVENSWEQFESKNLTLKGNRLCISLEKEIEAVKYGYENFPVLSIYNEKMYPVAPFYRELKA